MSLGDWRKSKLRDHGISEFFYFSMIENLESFLKHGILPKTKLSSRVGIMLHLLKNRFKIVGILVKLNSLIMPK